MPSKPQDPFKDLILDEEERLIDEAIQRDEYVDDPDFVNGKKLIEEAAGRYLKLNTTKPITLRVNQMDIIKIKAKAKRSNIPYQTLLSAAIHDFAEGKRELIVK